MPSLDVVNCIHKKRKKKRHLENLPDEAKRKKTKQENSSQNTNLIFPIQHILAPMVGASELAFRLLTRNYGVQLAFTPMMSAQQFVQDPTLLQTCALDRPLVCHFSANDPRDFAAAVRLAAPHCDAVDLNLGCPQRTAYVGHFGSYLLGRNDRNLVCEIVRQGVMATADSERPVPIFCKIRLLDTLEETIELCLQLQQAGASLIAIHARYRASWERKGPGARDGPALLDQVKEIKKKMSIPIIANGNVITYQDVVANQQLTGADGIMSAEGILDNPALFLPRLSSKGKGQLVTISRVISSAMTHNASASYSSGEKKMQKLLKRLRSIERLERKLLKGAQLEEKECKKLKRKDKYLSSLETLRKEIPSQTLSGETFVVEEAQVELDTLYQRANDKVTLAQEYLSFVRVYPVQLRSIIFHVRRMLKDELSKYQLLDDCLKSETVEQIHSIVCKISEYRADPSLFTYDREKARLEKEALERKRIEEGKRKAYEARMIRKAKREGKNDRYYYLNIGAVVPTAEEIKYLKELPRHQALEAWKRNHSQHCMNFHLDICQRDRSCAFLHVDVQGANSFVEQDEVAG